MATRLTSIKRKKKSPSPLEKTKEIVKRQKKVYLYYASDNDFCVELIGILVKIPELATSIKCIDVNEYDVDPAIDSIPTIDEGNDPDGNKILHKLENAFTWVLHQCYSLMEIYPQRVKSSNIAEIELRIKQVFRQLQINAFGEISSHDIMRTGKGENPAARYQSIMKEAENMSHLDYSGEKSVRNMYKYYMKQSEKNIRPKGGIEQRMQNLEEERRQMLEKYKMEWGPPTEPKTVKRENLKSNRHISEAEIKMLEQQRMSMLDSIAKTGNPNIREPIKRQGLKMGSFIGEKDLQNYEKQRQQMVQRISSY